jgi:hypothetical protein
MKSGMLWFDAYEGRDLAARIERAAQFYQSKYGTRPTLCFVHPTALAKEKLPATPSWYIPGQAGIEAHWATEAPTAGVPAIGTIEVRGTNAVLPNHYWLGVEDPKAEAK